MRWRLRIGVSKTVRRLLRATGAKEQDKAGSGETHRCGIVYYVRSRQLLGGIAVTPAKRIAIGIAAL